MVYLRAGWIQDFISDRHFCAMPVLTLMMMSEGSDSFLYPSSKICQNDIKKSHQGKDACFDNYEKKPSVIENRSFTHCIYMEA